MTDATANDRTQRLPLLAGMAVLALYLATGIYSVGSDESGVALRFGRAVNRNALPGIHWNLPWPFGRTIVEKTATSFVMPIGYRFVERIGRPPVSDLWLTGDANIVTGRMTVQYSLASLADFSFSHESPRELLRKAGEQAVSEILAGETVDGVLTGRRHEVARVVHDRIQATLDQMRSGVRVQSVSIGELAPPREGGVRSAFQEVQNASSDRERAIQEARAYAAQTDAESNAAVEAITASARADSHTRIETAGAEAERFSKLAAEHAKAPWLTEQRLYLETVERLLPETDSYVIEPSDNGRVNLRILK